MTRKQKLITNIATSLLRQFVALICSFILPKYILLYFGSEVNGLTSSIAHFLSFISLLDMGVGAVVQSNLYKPLAENDIKQISQVFVSSRRFFRRLAYIFLAYIAILVVFFPLFAETEFDAVYTMTLIVIIAISTFAQYFIGIPYQLLISADQKGYVQEVMQIATVLLNTIGSVMLMKVGASVHIVKLLSAGVFVLRPIGQLIYVKKNYKIDFKVKIDGEPIKQKWNGFSQHLSAVICSNVDVVALTAFSTMKNVSVYSVYFAVVTGVSNVIMASVSGLESLFGNMIAKSEYDKLNDLFEKVEWIIHNAVIIIFTVMAISIAPFVLVYTKEINDANYYLPLFGSLLAFSYAAQCLRIPYFRIIKAAGHYKQTQNGAYIAATINVIITIALVFKFELIGAAIGTFVAMLFHTCYFAWYLRKNIICRPLKFFVKFICTDCAVAFIAVLITSCFEFNVLTYISWISYAIKTFGVTLLSACVVNMLFYRKNMISLIKKGNRS